MKKSSPYLLIFAFVLVIIVASGYTSGSACGPIKEVVLMDQGEQTQTMNLFVTHGHCSTPFAGKVSNLKVIAPAREDEGNPLEEMQISFEIDPNTFNVCAGEELTERIKTPGLFISENNEKMVFTSSAVYTMGIDWYQLNGTLSIKGVEKEVNFFVTGIRDPKDVAPTSLVLQGQMDLLDWGIDYDKIVNGKSDSVPTKWMYVNMTIEMS